uniref:caspase-2-like n=1 Tax=Styela clava TaxID=7725 RepID=UPI00193ACC27|nr:caspase-2-like [Styela clava]
MAGYAVNIAASKIKNINIGNPTDREGTGQRLVRAAEFNSSSSGDKKSHVLIICNFEHELLGYRRDVRMLREMWENFGCEVKVKRNSSAEGMRRAVRNFANETCTGIETFIAVFVLSHGVENDYILGVDQNIIHVSEIIDRFNNKNVQLQNIPKLFFFQMCRGGRRDRGVRNTQVAAQRERPPRIPLVCDTLVTYPAQQGTIAFVEETGSWFIQALIEVFRENHERKHVVDMLTMVNKIMAEETARHDNDQDINGAKAMSEFTSTLRDDVYILGGQ